MCIRDRNVDSFSSLIAGGVAFDNIYDNAAPVDPTGVFDGYVFKPLHQKIAIDPLAGRSQRFGQTPALLHPPQLFRDSLLLLSHAVYFPLKDDASLTEQKM